MTSRRSRCPSRCTRSARAPRRCASRLWPSAGAPPERTDRRAARRDEHLTKEFTMPTGSSAPRATTPMSDMGSGTLRSSPPRHGANCARRPDGCASADAGWGDSVPVSKRSRSQSGRSTPSTRCAACLGHAGPHSLCSEGSHTRLIRQLRGGRSGPRFARCSRDSIHDRRGGAYAGPLSRDDQRGGEEEGRGDAENGAAAHCSRARQARDNIPGRNSNVLATGYRCDERFSPAPCLG